jgi:predicted nucleic acid-binding protein
MTSNPPSSPPHAVVIDANIAIAITAREALTGQVASAQVAAYSAAGCDFFAPGVLVAETLYVLCKKLNDGLLSVAEHALAVKHFQSFSSFILSPPNGDISLALRAEAIRGGYTCRRSADGIYIALAEELAVGTPTTLLTFDEDMVKQAAKHAPTVTAQLLTI